MLIQAQGYAKNDYQLTSYDGLYRTSRQHMGGCLWHSFDHQRGYHPDPFYGGIMDAFRQPKLSYYMFCSQRPAEPNKELIADNGPMIYIANAMTPFSPKDVTIYSNCDEVRLTYCKEAKNILIISRQMKAECPHPSSHSRMYLMSCMIKAVTPKETGRFLPSGRRINGRKSGCDT